MQDVVEEWRARRGHLTSEHVTGGYLTSGRWTARGLCWVEGGEGRSRGWNGACLADHLGEVVGYQAPAVPRDVARRNRHLRVLPERANPVLGVADGGARAERRARAALCDELQGVAEGQADAQEVAQLD